MNGNEDAFVLHRDGFYICSKIYNFSVYPFTPDDVQFSDDKINTKIHYFPTISLHVGGTLE